MVLDPNSKPNWKMACNTCHLIARFQADIHKIQVVKGGESCETCGAAMLEIEFHKVRVRSRVGARARVRVRREEEGVDKGGEGCETCGAAMLDVEFP